MKEAVGGSFMMKVFIVFLATYIVFIAIAINYAKAFRVKNKVINVIEQNEGVDFKNTKDTGILQIGDYMRSVGYNVAGRGAKSEHCKTIAKVSGDEIYYNSDYGYCISRIKGTSPDKKLEVEYYQVATFVEIYIPLVDWGYLIPIKGETRKIERIK